MENRLSKRELREKVLAKMLSLIKENPGIRPRELNRRLNLKHSANLRSSFLKQGLVRKERKGVAVRYYPTRQNKK